MLFNQRICGTPLLLLAVASNSVFSGESSQNNTWAIEYYSKNAACTVATIKHVERQALRVTVALDIEPASSTALAKGSAENRDNWMALHCPPEMHPAWTQKSKDFDITIIANLGGMGHHSLSCATYYDEQQAEREDNNASVLSQLKRLLDNR